MLIPSIDLQNGHVVQLVQGERLAIEAPDPEPWIQRFSRFPRVQLIDLDAARGRGDNAAMVASHLPAAALPRRRRHPQRRARAGGARCRRARGHRQLGALPRRQGGSGLRAAIAEAIGADKRHRRRRQPRRACRDSRLEDDPADHRRRGRAGARALLLPEFLYTHVDKEGMMQGTDMAAIMAVRAATTRRLTAAGGITTWDEIDALDAAGIDAVVGMAVYTGQLPLDSTEIERHDRA